MTQIEVFRKMSGAQKLRLSMRLYWSARRLKTAWIRQCNPGWSDAEVNAEVTRIFMNART